MSNLLEEKSVAVYLFFSHHGQYPLDHTNTSNHKQMQFFFSKSISNTHLIFKDDEIDVNYFQTDLDDFYTYVMDLGRQLMAIFSTKLEKSF